MVGHFRTIAKAYVLLLVLSALGLSLLSAGRKDEGCYLMDALVWGAECDGFVGASIVAFVLNLPLNLIYAPSLGFAGLFNGSRHWESLYLLGSGAVLWLPILNLLWHWLKRSSAPS